MKTISTIPPSNVKTIKDRTSPMQTFVWVTDGLGNWSQAKAFGDGTWEVKADFEGNKLKGKMLGDFPFIYWAPILEDKDKDIKIESFKNWYNENNSPYTFEEYSR